MVEKETVAQYEKGYVKLYKNTKGYNWEIKLYEDKDPKAISQIIKDITKLNGEMMNMFGGELE